MNPLWIDERAWSRASLLDSGRHFEGLQRSEESNARIDGPRIPIDQHGTWPATRIGGLLFHSPGLAESLMSMEEAPNRVIRGSSLRKSSRRLFCGYGPATARTGGAEREQRAILREKGGALSSMLAPSRGIRLNSASGAVEMRRGRAAVALLHRDARTWIASSRNLRRSREVARKSTSGNMGY